MGWIYGFSVVSPKWGNNPSDRFITQALCWRILAGYFVANLRITQVLRFIEIDFVFIRQRRKSLFDFEFARRPANLSRRHIDQLMPLSAAIGIVNWLVSLGVRRPCGMLGDHFLGRRLDDRRPEAINFGIEVAY